MLFAVTYCLPRTVTVSHVAAVAGKIAATMIAVNRSMRRFMLSIVKYQWALRTGEVVGQTRDILAGKQTESVGAVWLLRATSGVGGGQVVG